MRAKGQTSVHLLLASIVSIFGVLLILVIVAMSWEAWMIPVILTGNTLVWCFHIGRVSAGTFYENLCFTLLMIGFFFFGVHGIMLFDMPAVACMLVLVFSMFNKKRLLYMVAGLYVLVLFYHFFILHTINYRMGTQNILRLGIGAMVVAGAVGIAKYRINKRLESRKEYEGTLKKLEKAGRQNADFLSNVSHELRTPINMVMGISEVILEKDISPEVREEMQSIKMAGRRLSNQINNMLDYTEIVEGTLVPSNGSYMITSVINDIITMAAMQSSKDQLEMVFDVDPKIPSVLNGDVEKISHVLKILLENSIKFTEEGGINICIRHRRESYGINLTIDIYDTGIGMTEEQLAQMCDDFYQADTGSCRFAGGLGIGLPIARGLLHAMGGFVEFDSKEQQGLQVHITVPQGVEDDTPAMALADPESLCIACYFRPEKYNHDEVKRYYDQLILHMVEGLGIEGYQAHNFEGLLKLQRSHPLTHVFIAQSEYEENKSYYEELAGKLQVVAIVDQGFMLDRDSRLLMIRKPFFALSVVNLLNGEMDANEFGEAQAAGRRPFTCKGVRVLAVDDEEMNLMVAKGVLGSYGIQVDTCLSGKEALERCVSIPYDAVFLDHMMPGFDGVETLKQLREINNGVYRDKPVVALTANTISGAREMFQNEGFTEFIPKPIERTVLERVLRKVLPESSVQYDAAPKVPDSTPKTPVFAADRHSGVKIVREEAVPEKDVVIEDVHSKDRPEKIPSEENAFGETMREAPDVPGSEGREDVIHRAPVPEKDVSDGYIPEKDILEKADTKKDGPKEAAPKKYQEESADPKDMFSEQASLKEDLPEEADPGEDLPEGDVPVSGVPSSFRSLSHIGVNVQLGLDYCCGEEEFYLEMLQMFSSQAEEKKAELIALYEAADWENYAIKVHALKSTSMTIGAERLAEQAKLLEQAGKTQNTDYIQRFHPILLRLYDKVCETIFGL